jgi:chromosome segregation ATPase
MTKTKEEMANEYAMDADTHVEANAKRNGFLTGHASRDGEFAAKDARIDSLEQQLTEQMEGETDDEFLARFVNLHTPISKAIERYRTELDTKDAELTAKGDWISTLLTSIEDSNAYISKQDTQIKLLETLLVEEKDELANINWKYGVMIEEANELSAQLAAKDVCIVELEKERNNWRKSHEDNLSRWKVREGKFVTTKEALTIDCDSLRAQCTRLEAQIKECRQFRDADNECGRKLEARLAEARNEMSAAVRYLEGFGPVNSEEPDPEIQIRESFKRFLSRSDDSLGQEIGAKERVIEAAEELHSNGQSISGRDKLRNALNALKKARET